IVFPQALRVALPPLSNSFIGLVKDTSLASSITIVEMFMVSQQIASNNYQPLLMYSIVAAIYALFCTVLSILQHYLEKWTSRYVDAVGE
ncbi:ABC transporter permease subunit, partial [Streptomyces xinghaiensis]